MLTQLDIINTALVSLGAEPVQSLAENSAHARAAKAFWNLALLATLRAHPWNFAISRKVLAPQATAPAFGFGYSFQLPADWLRTLSADVDSYKQEGSTILCDQMTVNLRYVRLVDDPARFDALFGDALAAHLACKLAIPLTQSSSQAQVCWNAYSALLKLARSVDSQEDIPDEFEESSLLTMRG